MASSSPAGSSSLPPPPKSPVPDGIPPKPSTSLSPQTLPHDLETSSSIAPLCVICTVNSARYTCPRCQLRTCSLPCSTKHKSLGDGCSGIRNKAAYVPMNQYGYAALMNDYTFLEDVERKVTEWGRDIVQGGFQSQATATNANIRRGRGRGRGQGRGRGYGHGHGMQGATARPGNTSKRDILKMELDFRDIEMDMLSVGMEKRTLNQSTWDSINNTALLTIEFIFHTPPDPYAPSSQAPEPPFKFLAHRNRLDETISQCIQSRISERAKSKKEKQVPQWLYDLVAPDPPDSDSFQPPTCVMPTLVDPLASLQPRSIVLRPGHITRHGYYKLSFSDTLEIALKHKQFVEYPTIEVWEKDAFTGTVVDDGGAVMLDEIEERKPKRRKLGAREGKKAITGLLGDYGSDEEDGVGEEAQEERSVFDLLAGYAGSDDEHGDGDGEGEGEGETKVEPKPVPHLPFYLNDDELGDEDAEGETDDELVEEANTEELAVMLEKLRQAGALRDPSGDGRLARGIEDEDQVDWGDSEDEA